MEQEGAVFILSPETLTPLTQVKCLKSSPKTANEIVVLACQQVNAGFDPKNMILRDAITDKPIEGNQRIPAGSCVLLTTSKEDYPERRQYMTVMMPNGTFIPITCSEKEDLPELVFTLNIPDITPDTYLLVKRDNKWRLVLKDPNIVSATLVLPNGKEAIAVVNAFTGTPERTFLERISWALEDPFDMTSYTLDRDTVYPGDTCHLIARKISL